jgi:hypothetical protein
MEGFLLFSGCSVSTDVNEDPGGVEGGWATLVSPVWGLILLRWAFLWVNFDK